MSDELVKDLRGLQADGKEHGAGVRPTHCDVCGVRVPCDYMIAGDVCGQAADCIEGFQALRDAPTVEEVMGALNFWRDTHNGFGVNGDFWRTAGTYIDHGLVVQYLALLGLGSMGQEPGGHR